MLFFLSNLLANPVTSFGQNPLVSIGGTAYDAEQKNLLTAPVDQDLVITDLILTSTSNMTCKRAHKTDLMLTSGAVLAQFETVSAHYNGTHGASTGLSIQHAFSGGLRVPAGDTLALLVIQSDSYGGSCGSSISYGVRYMVSGHYVAP